MERDYVHRRLAQALDYLRDNGRALNQDEIATLIGSSRPNVCKAIKGDTRYLTEGFLRRFASAYSDYINAEWLIDGVGEMAVPGPQMRPHLADITAAAGFLDGVDAPDSIEMMDASSFIPEYDFTITAEGNSMAPDIHSGDILFCRMLSDSANPPIGQICVIVSGEGTVVKRVDGATVDGVRLHSINPDYSDIIVSASAISHVARVVAITRSI